MRTITSRKIIVDFSMALCMGQDSYQWMQMTKKSTWISSSP